MRMASEINKDNLDSVSLFHGHFCEYQGEGFVDCILALPPSDFSPSWHAVSDQVEHVVGGIADARRMIAGDGSLWLWAKDLYVDGGLAMLPSKIVARLMAKNEWLVRNEVAWECKVSDPAPENRLKRSCEKLFHLVTGMGYFYDRRMGIAPRKGQAWQNGTLEWKNDMPSSRTGVVGRKYCRYINESPDLTDDEKKAARAAMMVTFGQLNAGEISDYRVAIRGIHKVSGSRAREVAEKGFSISKTRSHSMPLSDLWRDARGSTNKWVPPSVLASMVRLTCRPEGAVLDLFPSEETAAAVVSTGRKYVAVCPNGPLLDRIERSIAEKGMGGNLFEEANEDVEETQNRPEEDHQEPREAHEAVQTGTGEPTQGEGC